MTMPAKEIYVLNFGSHQCAPVLSVPVCLSLCLSFCLSVCVCVCVYTCPSVHLCSQLVAVGHLRPINPPHPPYPSTSSTFSRMRRALEAASLLLNLIAFYLIVSLNKKLFKAKDKGGYGLKVG